MAEKSGFSNKVSVKKEVDKAKKDYEKALAEFKFNEALKAIWDLISFSDKYIEKKKPWETEDKDVLANLLFILDNIAELLSPFLPETSEKMLKELERNTKFKNKKGKSLFPRLDKTS